MLVGKRMFTYVYSLMLYNIVGEYFAYPRNLMLRKARKSIKLKEDVSHVKYIFNVLRKDKERIEAQR